MVKKSGRKKRENSVNRQYMETFGEVYKNKGLLPAINYSIGSTFYSLGNRLMDFFYLEPLKYRVQTPQEIKNRGFKGIYLNEAWDKWTQRKKHRKENRINHPLLWKNKNLENEVSAVFAVIGLGAGIFFLSPVVTGNVISNLTQTNSILIGGVLFVIGLAGAFIYFKKR